MRRKAREIMPSADRPGEAIFIQVSGLPASRPSEVWTEITVLAALHVVGRHLSRSRLEPFEAPQVGLTCISRITAVDHAAALLFSLQEPLLDGRRRVSIAELRDKAVAPTFSATAPEEAGKAMAFLVRQVAGLCSRLTATTRANPTAAAQVETSADDAVLVV